MKVIQINTVTNGSTGRIARDIAKLLKDNGHECLIAFGRGNTPDDGLLYYKFADKLSVYFHAFMSRLTDKVGFYSVRNTKKLVKYIREYNPDVIHLHNLHGYYINIEILFKFLAEFNKPVVWTFHDCWPFTGHCCYFDMVGCNKWQESCCDCLNLHEYPKSFFMDSSLWNYRKKRELFCNIDNLTIVSVSKWLDGLVENSYFKGKNHNVIYNGIDLNMFKPTTGDFREKYGIDSKKIILGVASVWDNRKGLHHFIGLSKLLDDEYVIVLVGLKRGQIKRLPKNIIGIERTDSVLELVKIYSASDVFVNASVEETMGLVTIESIACGTPVIVFNKTAIPEVVNENNGVVLEDNTECGIYYALQSLPAYSQEKMISTIQRYQKDNSYSNYKDLYAKLKHVVR